MDRQAAVSLGRDSDSGIYAAGIKRKRDYFIDQSVLRLAGTRRLLSDEGRKTKKDGKGDRDDGDRNDTDREYTDGKYTDRIYTDRIYTDGRDVPGCRLYTSQRLWDWLRTEMHNPELADRLQKGMEAGGSLQNMVLTILRSVDFYSQEELTQLTAKMKVLNTYQEQERLKLRADEYFVCLLYTSVSRRIMNLFVMPCQKEKA